MMKCRFEWRSTRNSILPPLMSVTALATSGVTVPVFGLGMRPRGPRTRPRRPTLPIMSGVEVEPAAVDLLDQLVATDDVGAGLTGGVGLVAVGEHQDLGGLAGAVGQVDRAADHLVGLAGVDTEAHGHVDGLVELLLGAALGDLDRGEGGVELVLVERLRGGAVCLAALHVLSSVP